MGSLGIPEMMFIFVLALLLFGPKKLPELGRTVGKALAEFRRAQGELKATFDREMKNLERETESLKEATNNYYNDSYNYDHSYDHSSSSSYDPDSYSYGSHDSTATNATTESASATQGAESTTATLHLTGEAPEGTVASGSYSSEGSYDNVTHENGHENSHSEAASNDSNGAHGLGESGKAEPTVKS